MKFNSREICLILFLTILVSCENSPHGENERNNNPESRKNISDEDQGEKDEENGNKYWSDIKKWSKKSFNKASNWTSETYEKQKKWVNKKWPEASQWGKDAVDNIVEMSVDFGDDLKKIELNIFSLEDDVKFGKTVYDEIQKNHSEYKILDRKTNPDKYDKVQKIINDILSSGKVQYKNQFKWELTIIKDDNTINAMCAPGGYIFVYTGLLNFCKSESQLAGVLGHEIAHADKRHGTRQLTYVYGADFLLSFITDDENVKAAQIAAGLLNLKHSRSHERQADEYSVIYLCNTGYESDGVASFFQQFETQNTSILDDLTSTHPNHKERISNVRIKKKKLNCKK